MSLKEGRTDPAVEPAPSPIEKHVAEWVCTDCDYDEFRTTTGVTGSLDRCPACGGHLIMPRDAMS
ncbi:hypothetical protein [Haloplanus aerogenes]|uniref:Uncharacterized protein n=1 Tax=Haloplanus aerogenes TaxID=660522 RepID=A0A3M0E691_9EURY|nr:hypothetical protein [Haloplanus aerogenes]AZH24669.1 hypothetical protein DU502_04395 [Haloplanus aerogenes]RMB23673.1 hypothetical protein ATH50_0897 [Haloplanus aerogenes]